MKKLLSIFSAFIITAGGASGLVSCSSKTPSAPKIDKDKIAKNWLESVSPQIFQNIFKSVSPYISVEQNPDKGADAIIANPTSFFKAFNYNITDSVLMTDSDVENAIFTYFSDYLTKHNKDILSQLDSANHQYYSEFIDPNVGSEFSIDPSSSKINVEPYYWDPTVADPKCNVFLDGKTSLTEWQNDYKDHGSIADLYSISIEFQINANFIGEKGSEQATIDCSNSPVETILYSDPNGKLPYYLSEASNTVINTLSSNSFIINSQDDNFSFEQSKGKINDLLKQTISGVFNQSEININGITINNLGEWGNLDENVAKDSWWKGDNYLFNQLTNNSSTMKGEYLKPKQNLTPDVVDSYFKTNDNTFTGKYGTQFSTWQKDEKASGGQSVPWTTTKLLINDTVWNKFTSSQNNAIDYGYFTIDNWSVSNTKLGQSWKIPYAILTPNNNAAIDFYSSKDKDIINLFGGNSQQNESSLFDNFQFFANNITIKFDDVLNYLKNNYWYAYYALTWWLTAQQLANLEKISITTGVNLVEGIDKKNKTASTFTDNSSFGDAFSSIFKNSGIQNSSAFFGPINPITGKTGDISYITPNHSMLDIGDYTTEKFGQYILSETGDKNVANKGPEQGQVSASTVTFGLLMNIANAINNAPKDKTPEQIALGILNDNLPKFIVSVDGILIDCNPGISFNLGASLTDK